jgi:hypothetical protein
MARTKNIENYTGFRPRVEVEPQYECLRELLKRPQMNKSFSALLNSIIPHLYYAMLNTTEYDEDGTPSAEFNLGRVKIK